MQASQALLEKHYADLSKKPFFAGLVKYMASGPVVAMVWEGLNAVKTGRVMLGETNPADSKPGTIRGDFAVQVGRNICHGSDAVESANHEIALWFKPEELVAWESAQKDWVYELILTIIYQLLLFYRQWLDVSGSNIINLVLFVIKLTK